MPNLIDIQTVCATLITLLTAGGSNAAIELLKGMTTNGALKLKELQEQLSCKQEVIQAVEQCQQYPDDTRFRTQLEGVLIEELKQHTTLVQEIAPDIKGNIKADRGSVAAGVISGGNITTNNTFNDKD
jgi:hypothetical protein